jgi:hypothetical protein
MAENPETLDVILGISVDIDGERDYYSGKFKGNYSCLGNYRSNNRTCSKDAKLGHSPCARCKEITEKFGNKYRYKV